jgi:FkbM family methyltransferase
MQVHGVELIEKGDRVCINHVRDGYFEPQSMAFWKWAMSPGKVAIDVGAYTGVYALVAAKAGAIAVAYEPNKYVYRRLVRNAKANGLKVDARNSAAFSSDGEADFWFRFDMTSAGRLTEKAGFQQCRVRTEVIREDRPVCAVKVDVEGAEIEVLRGLRPILERDRPIVIAEALNDKQRAELDEFMATIGYRGVVADRRNLVYRHG